MTRQVLYRDAKLEKLANARMPQFESGIAKLALQRVAGVLVLPGIDQAGQTAKRFFIKAQHLADFTGCRTAAIGDDVGRHSRTEFAITVVNILNRLLALIAAGKIEIDIRPLAPLLRKEAFKQQLHSNGVDGRNAQRITDRAIGSRASSLNQDALLAAVTHNVPDNKEISF